jgi:hypothetical protein
LKRPDLALLVLCLAACQSSAPPPASSHPSPAPIAFSFPTDTVRNETLAPGVLRRFVYSKTGPWAIHVLDVDLAQCNSAIAVKGKDLAAGRTRTTALLAGLQPSNSVVGGVNADFFSLANGTPVGALISRGRVVTGPYTQPVLAFDSTGAAHALVLRVDGSATIGGTRLNVRSWNRPEMAGVAFYDAAWGRTTDTATSLIEVVLDGRDPSRVVAVDTARTGVVIPANGGVLVAGRTADVGVRNRLLALVVGDTVRVAVALAPFHPREAVGGRPMLARDSVVVPEVETEGQASFQARNPRTAAGIARGGKRLILVVVDGRQKGYSDGMTLREMANLMLALGSRDAINLDGGGSSTLVYSPPGAPAALKIANSPSDSSAAGPHLERAVGDALSVIRGCGIREVP